MEIKPIKTNNTDLFNKYLIPNDIIRICKKLKQNGHISYLVGGCIRDLLLGNIPKDFDIVTNAQPEEIKKIFKKRCRIIGKRFKLAHIYISKGEIVEVSTFRSASTEDNNIFGTEQEDVFKRDLTINALYYDVISNILIDYVNGLEDIKNKNIKMIGSLKEKILDDPARMIRLIRYSEKTEFGLHEDTIDMISDLAHHINECSVGRLFEELKKDLETSKSYSIFCLYHKTGLFKNLFPSLYEIWKRSENISYKPDEVFYMLQIYDELFENDPDIAIGFSSLLFPFFNMISKNIKKEDQKRSDIVLNTAEKIISPISKKYQMPKYIINQFCSNMYSFELIRKFAVTQKTFKKLTTYSRQKDYNGSIRFYELLSEAIPEYFIPVSRTSLTSLSNNNFYTSHKYRKRKKN